MRPECSTSREPIRKDEVDELRKPSLQTEWPTGSGNRDYASDGRRSPARGCSSRGRATNIGGRAYRSCGSSPDQCPASNPTAEHP